jgi:hypothetical protein
LTTFELMCVAGTALNFLVQAILGLTLFSFTRGKQEADFVRRVEMHQMRQEFEQQYARRSETALAIEGLKNLTNERIDNLEDRLEAIQEQVSSGVDKVIAKLEAMTP